MISIAKMRKNLGDWSQALEEEMRTTLDAVVRTFESETRRQWRLTTEEDPFVELIETEKCDEKLFVGHYPMSVCTLEEYDNDPDDAEEIEAADVSISLASGVVRRVRTEPFLRFVRVTAVGGYADDAAPADVIYAIICEVRRAMARNQPQRLGVSSSSGSVGAAMYEQVSRRHPEFKRAIERHRKRT